MDGHQFHLNSSIEFHCKWYFEHITFPCSESNFLYKLSTWEYVENYAFHFMRISIKIKTIFTIIPINKWLDQKLTKIKITFVGTKAREKWENVEMWSTTLITKQSQIEKWNKTKTSKSEKRREKIQSRPSACEILSVMVVLWLDEK